MNFRALKFFAALAAIVCIVLPAAWASAQQAQGLAAVGAVDPANGFPKWYLDKNGLQLGACLDVGALDPCGLIAAGAIPNPALPISFPANFPGEFFYMRATARIDGIGGGLNRADLGLAHEGAFAGGVVAAGNQITFARLRLRVTGGLVPGATYTMTTPYGTKAFVAAATGTINFTDTQGCLAAPPACPFALALANTNVGPFVQWDPAASVPPAGYIGQPAIPHAIIASPFGTNIFRLAGLNVGGPGINVVETNLFRVTGKLFVRDATTTTLTSTPNPSAGGQAVTLTATVTPVPPAAGVPTGTIAFKDGGVTIGTATLVNGTATLSISTLAGGARSLTAVYSGSLDFLPSTSPVLIQNVVVSASTTTLTSSANPIRRRQAVTFTATVSPVAPATATPTGSVTFKDGATVLATVPLVAGKASFTTTRLEAGTHPITATYPGSTTFGASASAVLNQVITP